MCAALALSLTGLALLGQTPVEPYVWPLDLPRELTSSFAEYRPGRYHMGIDLRTGPVGKNVYAADDGEVERVVCSPYGYGKAIYLRVRDGNTIVYAHLDEFMPPLDAYVRRAQHARQSYTVDLRPEPAELPIARGQIIAKSGQTGIGVPHLHYEIRENGDVPVHPGRLGITWPDSTKPVFRGVAIVPLEPDSTVNGDLRPVFRVVTIGAGGVYSVPEVRVSGPFAIAVDVFDPAAGGSKLGVHRLVSTVDGREVFQLTHDRLTYTHLDDGAAAYESAFADRGQFLWLWRKPGNESEIYPQDTVDGRFDLAEGLYEIGVAASDYHGNSASLVLPVRRVPAREVSIPQPSHPVNTGRGSVSFEYTGVQFLVTAEFDANETVAPTLRIEGATPERVPMRQVSDGRTYRAAYRPDEAYADARVSVGHPRIDAPPERVVFLQRSTAGRPDSINLGPLRIRPGESLPYGVLPIRVRRVETSKFNSELIPVSPVLELWPPGAVLDGYMQFAIARDGAAQATSNELIYRQRRDGWEPVPRDTREGGDAAYARTARLGVYALMADDVPPRIRVLEPAPGADPSRRPELKIEITDEGSGIDRFDARFNDTWLLMEYDPEQDLLRWERDEDLPVGPGRLHIEISDRAGNVSRREVELNLPD